MKKWCSLFFVFCLVQITALPSLNVFKISAENADEKTVSNINDAIFGFLSENKEYKIVDCRTFFSPDADNVPSADFSFYGNLLDTGTELQLDLVLKNVDSGTTRLLSRNYANVNLLLLESKTLLQQLLNLSYELPSIAVTKTSVDTEIISDGLPGTWSGESDIKNIKLLQNGRGVIIFGSGLSISVEYTEKNGSVVITQKTAISERQFPDVPAELIADVIKKAAPLTWKLKRNGTTLSGTRNETVVTSANGEISSIKTETKNVVWKKVQ